MLVFDAKSQTNLTKQNGYVNFSPLCYPERQLITAYTGHDLSISRVKPFVLTRYIQASPSFNSKNWIGYESRDFVYHCSNRQSTCLGGSSNNTVLIQGCAKEMSPCLKIPAPVLPGNLASPCTADQPISESLS